MNLDDFKKNIEAIKNEQAERAEREQQEADALRRQTVKFIRVRMISFLDAFGILAYNDDFLDETPVIKINGVCVTIEIGKNDLPTVSHILTGATRYVDLTLTFNGAPMRFNGHLNNPEHYQTLLLNLAKELHLD